MPRLPDAPPPSACPYFASTQYHYPVFASPQRVGVSADLRTATDLPDGVSLVGGEAVFEGQEDGNSALLVPEGAHLRVAMPGISPWSLEDDGRIHRYSLLIAVRLDRLPSAPMPIFNGSSPPTGCENVDHVYLYSNGGIGALGQQGVRDAAIRAERWAWIVITRSGNDVHTYNNGRLCAKVDVTVKQPKGASGEGPKKKQAAKEGDEDGDAETKQKQKQKEAARLPERLCIDPQYLALFAPHEGAEAAEDGERGLAIRYIKLVRDDASNA